MVKRISGFIYLAVVLLLSFYSCEEEKKEGQDVALSAAEERVEQSLPGADSVSYQLFDVVDSTGQPHGVGYDIFIGSKKMIHQTSIPGEQGNNGFINREEAQKVADLVVGKMKAGGGFPTVTRMELDSLKITLQSK